MADKKKSKNNNKKENTKKQTEKPAKNIGKQAFAVILFFVSLLILIMTIFDGPKVWGTLHNFFRGLTGFFSFLWPIVACVCAAFISFNKPVSKKNKFQAIGISVVLFLTGTLVEVIVRDNSFKYGEYIKVGFSAGIKGGGFLGTLLAYPFSNWFGKPGAAIILGIIVVILLFLILGITLGQFLNTVSKPAKKISDDTKTVIENKKAKREKEKQEKEIDRDSVDMPLDDKDEKERRKKKNSGESIEEKRKKLVAEYNGEEYNPPKKPDISVDDEPLDVSGMEEVPEAEEESSNLDDIISKFNEDVEKNSKKKKPEKDIEVISSESAEYKLPPLDLLNSPEGASNANVEDELRSNAELLVNTLKSFGVETRIVDICRGPSVTRYELQPAAGVKISKITSLADDIALNLASSGVRIEAPIPNKAAVGIEVPNKTKNSVCLREVLDSPKFEKAESKLTVAVGKDVAGNIITTDIAKMPHLLVAGTTGSGKSVCINSFILSVLFNATPDEVKLLLIDPKMVEFEVFNGLPHLLVPVVSDARKASGALSWAVIEMEKRYKIFSECRVRDLDAYNEMAKVSDEYEPMPQILIVVDEFADLMMVASSEVEDSVCRIAQKARAAGMHLIIATQRPSTDVITGVIKANIPSRIALTVSNQTDSRIIIDTGGAEKLIGKGDMLLYPVGLSKPMRVQGCWVSPKEIKKVVDFIINQREENGGTVYDDEIEKEIERQAAETKGKKSRNDSDDDFDDELDSMFNEAVELVVESGIASTSMLQRRLRLGYARAGRIVDQLEAKGIIGPSQGAKPREVLLTKQQWYEMKMSNEE